MNATTNLILAAPPEYIRRAAETHRPVAHMIYRIGRGYHLFRAQNAVIAGGGLMVVDTDGYTGGGPMAVLVSEILNECEKNAYTGIVLDIGSASPRPLAPLAGYLGLEARERGLDVFVPQSLADAGSGLIVLLPSALSGGTLHDHIADAQSLYGAERVALEIERVRMDFTLPAASGTGRALSENDLKLLMEQYNTRSFLSRDLCAYYFTYQDRKGTHIVLYDNAASIRRKLQVASALGVRHAFVFYPHVADIIDDILV
jgi:hypothetical protein